MDIQVLIDNPNSWIVPYAKDLLMILQNQKHQAVIVHDPDKVVAGELLCLLSCEKKFENLQLNKYNLIVHESYLPKGKGWSPLTWQILENEKEIPITLFSASPEIDSGDIYLQEVLYLDGSELVGELREKQGRATIDLIIKFVKDHSSLIPKKQKGESSYYKRRTRNDSRLNVDQTIREQFNLFRVVDNERYPAFFELHGHKYEVKITKVDK
jgi:methionyl-tRNA formyltransferase